MNEWCRSQGIPLLFLVDGLEPDYVPEYLETILNREDENVALDYLVDQKLSSLLRINAKDHSIAEIKNDSIMQKWLCDDFFLTHRYLPAALSPVDSVAVPALTKALRYKDINIKVLNDSIIFLHGYGYEQSLTSFNRKSGETTDVLDKLLTETLVRNIYIELFGKEVSSALKSRTNMRKNGRIGGYKEFDLTNLYVKNDSLFLFFDICTVFPDSTTLNTVVLIHTDPGLKKVNYFVMPHEAYAGEYKIGISPMSQVWNKGYEFYLPVYSLNRKIPDKAYNMARFSLQKNKMVFRDLMPFYESVEKQKILKTRLYNFLSERSLVRLGDSFYVMYLILPYVYASENRIRAQFSTEFPWFEGNFKILQDTIFRPGSNGLNIRYYQMPVLLQNPLFVFSSESGKLFLSKYDSSFRLLKRTELLTKASFWGSDFYNDHLYYGLRSPEPPYTYWLYRQDISWFTGQ